jgi:hypothetical protein
MLEWPRNAAGMSPATVVAVTTMLRLTKRRRAVLAEKVPDVANLITAAIVIGYAIGESNVSWLAVIAAIALWTGVLGVALWIAEDK